VRNFYCLVQSKGLLHNVECNLLAIAKFLVFFLSLTSHISSALTHFSSMVLHYLMFGFCFVLSGLAAMCNSTHNLAVMFVHAIY